MSQIQIRDKFSNPLTDIYVRVALGKDKKEVSDAYDDKPSDNDGNLSFPVVLPSANGYTLQINNSNINPKYQSEFINTDRIDAQDIIVNLQRSPLERVSLNGFYFNKFIKGESAFLDYYRFLRGEDINPLLLQSMMLGSNCRRVFLMTHYTGIAGGIGVCNPDDYGDDFYDKFPNFLNWCQEYGIYIYASVFPDNKLISNWSNIDKQKEHWGRLGEIARAHAGMFALELTNEIDAHDFNDVDPTKFSSHAGVLCCSGSRGDTGGNPMPSPQWDFCDYHSPRFYPNEIVDMCVANHPSRLRAGKAMMLGEPLGYGVGNNRNSDTRLAKEAAGTSRGTAAGVIFHSTHGGFSQLYDEVEMNCAKAWFGEL